MNDRYKTIFYRSTLWCQENPSNEAWLWEEQFAKLMIEDIILQLENGMEKNGCTPENRRTKEHIRAIKEYYGVDNG